ncbi:MAG: YbaK/EbsC family protein [Proteobacteria bacterium]|nr:YbaK/EbsC family protein [Pseudomonadota bacterium]
MLSTKLKNCLEEHHIWYNSIKHSIAYTSQEIAEQTHVSGKEFAKTLIIKQDSKLVMVVIPADRRLDLKKLKKNLGATNIELAAEEEFRELFPDCEMGAMPPFGNLYGMDVYLAKAMVEGEEISFNAGTHSDIVKLSFEDYAKLVHPIIMECSHKTD